MAAPPSKARALAESRASARSKQFHVPPVSNEPNTIRRETRRHTKAPGIDAIGAYKRVDIATNAGDIPRGLGTGVVLELHPLTGVALGTEKGRCEASLPSVPLDRDSQD
jgi:hypothetical protein